MTLNCEIIVGSDVEHLRQIYTGFHELHRQGFLRLKQTVSTELADNPQLYKRWVDYRFFNTTVIVNKNLKVVYDLHDWNWIDEEILRDADFYFKRSYDPAHVSALADGRKVFKLGLNYPVSSSSADVFRLARAKFYGGGEKLKHVVKSLKIVEALGRGGESEQIRNLEGAPDLALEPKIIFMARAWDTDTIEAQAKKEQVRSINDFRAECVRILRREFGDRFFGGLAVDDFSRRLYPDALLPDGSFAGKLKYLDILKGFPICVTTTGLNNSIGWKLGEFVALSKAIVTEPLSAELPGDFAAGRNYLEFTDASSLIGAAQRLIDDRRLRESMMTANHRYYKEFLRPDMLVRHTLETVVRESGGKLD